MAKYVVSCLLVLCFVLENKNFYSRVQARAHPANNLQQQYNQLQPMQLTSKKHIKLEKSIPMLVHVQQRLRNRRSIKPESNEDDDNAAIQRYYARLRRHLVHQHDHWVAQEARYHHAPSNELRSMPRIWQHLFNLNYDDIDQVMELDEQDSEENMLSDDPIVIPNEIEQQSVVEVPPNSPTTADTEEQSSVSDIEPTRTQAQTQTQTVGCPKCESSRQVEHISEEELTRLRIEYVKQQILEKLRLKERPNVSAVGLPKPIYEGVNFDQQTESTKNKDLDDYYARTSKKFIFLKREKRECQRLGVNHPAMCFSFKIDDADADGFDVSTAVLWIYKNKQNRTINKNETILNHQTIVVSEVQQQLESKYLPVTKTIAIQSVDVQDEWMKIDIEWPIRRWFGNHDLSHIIQITCESCDISSMHEMISIDKDYRPFIIIDTQNRRRQTRQKRSINCSDGITECCRDKLYISFEEIGWGDWIIQPRGYDAYFCRGSCSSVASKVAQSSSHHNTFLAKVLAARRGQKPLELVPCCTAKQYSSLQLVFLDSNNTATQKTFPNMVVESCGCR